MMTISAAVFSFEASAAEYPTPVRIGLSYGTTAADSATLEAQGGFTVNVESEEFEPVSLDVNQLIFTVSENTLHAATVFGTEIASVAEGRKISIEPLEPDETILYADKPYRGGFEVFADKNGTITVVNVLDL